MRRSTPFFLAAAWLAACSSTPPPRPEPLPLPAPVEVTRADLGVLQSKLPALGQIRFTLPSGKTASCDPVRCELKWVERSVPVIGLRREKAPDVAVEVTLSAGHFGELLSAMDSAKSQKAIVTSPSSLGEIRCTGSRCELPRLTNGS